MDWIDIYRWRHTFLTQTKSGLRCQSACSHTRNVLPRPASHISMFACAVTAPCRSCLRSFPIHSSANLRDDMSFYFLHAAHSHACSSKISFILRNSLGGIPCRPDGVWSIFVPQTHNCCCRIGFVHVQGPHPSSCGLLRSSSVVLRCVCPRMCAKFW